jgi:hypothetical protein
VKSDLKAGQFNVGIPLTIEVPKSFRIKVAAPIKRLGPNFSRPGSILLPNDRLLYQALADEAAKTVSSKIDGKRSFSHKLAKGKSSSMFHSTRECWGNLQSALRRHSKKAKYILRLDIANYFGSINQHTLINDLSDAKYPASLKTRLEVMLTSFTTNRSSRGLIQGIYPSDFFGNYYMAPIDRFFDDYGVPSARYVDDLYVFFKNVDQAEKLMRRLIPELRTYDLVINEAKSSLMPQTALVTEEPDLENLFSKAIEEIQIQLEDSEFETDYGFQSDWDDDEDDEVDDSKDDDKEEDLELQATKLLFSSISTYPGHEESIERFCLPLFAKASSDFALAHVLEAFTARPSMTQIYSAYAARFITNPKVVAKLTELLEDSALGDWQRMWILAALIQMEKSDDKKVKIALGLLTDNASHEALKAISAIFVGKFGDHSRRKGLEASYPNQSPYVKLAIYYSSRHWPKNERNNAKANWASHSPLNKLMTTALAKV